MRDTSEASISMVTRRTGRWVGNLEEFLAFNTHRPSRGRRDRGQSISIVHHAHIVIDLRAFFDDIAARGWEHPRTLLMHRGDIPRRTLPLARALTPDIDRALMASGAGLDDRPPRYHRASRHRAAPG
jgi:hypothetical protein